MKKHYLKDYQYGAALAHFIAQASPHAQPLLSVALKREPFLKYLGVEKASGADNAKVEWVKGTSASVPKYHKPDLRRYRYRILDQLAETVADHLRLGIVHGDLHLGNVILAAPAVRHRKEKASRCIRVGFGYPGMKRMYYERTRIARPIKVKVVDYERALPLFSDREKISKKRPDCLRSIDIWSDYEKVRKYVTWDLAENDEERKRLKEYFERKFLQRIEKL